MKYNIIGDIHGRDGWRNLIIKDGVNIFVGDYFSPYFPYITFEMNLREVEEIIRLRREDPEHFVLLLGNHDLDHWMLREYYSRFDFQNVDRIEKLFEDNKDLFQMAYSIDNQVLITHAGVTVEWYWRDVRGMAWEEVLERRMNDRASLSEGLTPDEVCKGINALWDGGRGAEHFNFADHASHSDCYGTTPLQSCVWIRPDTLFYHDVFNHTEGFVQVFGHTCPIGRCITKVDGGKFILVDCLSYKNESLIIDTNNGITLWRNQNSTLAAL